jgi:pentose-5-phosphate-3-epimerase
MSEALTEGIERAREVIGQLKYAQDLLLHIDGPLDKKEREEIAEACDEAVVALRLILRGLHEKGPGDEPGPEA